MTVHGKIDCYTPAERSSYLPAVWNGTASRHLMKMTWDALTYFARMGLCESVAWFRGHGASPGNDGPEGPNPWGTNGWFLFRFPPTANRPWPWYFHMHWTIGYSTGAEQFGITDHPGKLCALSAVNDIECIGVQIARGIGSTATIWNGTANADGNDIKGTAPYWKVPAGGTRVAVLGRSNGPAGAFATGKENFTPIYYLDADYANRIHFLCDGDAFVMVHSFGGTNYSLRYYGQIETQPSLTDGAMILLHAPLSMAFGNDFGSLAGSDWSGGLDVAGQERIMRFDYPYYTSMGPYHPNHLCSPNRYDAFRQAVISYETLFGLAGYLNHELVEQCWYLPSHDVNGDASRAFFSDGGSSGASISIAWDGVSTPGINATRAGIEF